MFNLNKMPLKIRPSNLKVLCRHLHKICIVGSGPAGFYAAQQLIKGKKDVKVDIFEKLPVPFGLVRYGVAPDHPEVKNVINTFLNVLQSQSVRFFGNLEIGKEITFSHLTSHYDAILLCYGSSEDRKLGIPGEKDVISGREFVGWYNGLPENKSLGIDLTKSSRAFIIGQGNVALDICRILLSPLDSLARTDISKHAFEALISSKVKEVFVFGRRGPLQVAFTIKELRELINLPRVSTLISNGDFGDFDETSLSQVPRPRKRLMELLYKTSNEKKELEDKKFHLKFFRSPLKYENGIMTFGITKLDGERDILTRETEILESDLVFRSIGYKGRCLFPQLPFDEKSGIIPNVNGKVERGIYCSGWLASGPRGVILSTMQDAFVVAKKIIEDLDLGDKLNRNDNDIIDLLPKDKMITTFKDYLKIAEFEKKSGTKVVTIDEMLKIAKNGS